MPSRKAAISLEFPFRRVWDLKALTQPMIVEMRGIGSQSHLSKLAERMPAPLFSMRIQPQPQTVCLFPNAVVNNDANLWIITRLAPANDETRRNNRMMPARWSMQTESLLSTNPVLLRMPRTKRADLADNPTSGGQLRSLPYQSVDCHRMQRSASASRGTLIGVTLSGALPLPGDADFLRGAQ